jgi:hypothetical protein
MNKIIIVGLLGFINYAHAWDAREHIELTDEQKYEYFTKNGLPAPGSGVHIMPAANMSESIAKKIAKSERSIANKGYIEEKNEDAKFLLEIKKLSAADLAANLDNHDPHSTHMRASAREVHTAYDYAGVPANVVSIIIGFSARGAFMDNKGWTGATEFFEPKNFSATTCSYSQSNIKLTGGSANLAQEIVSYDVNKKVSIVEVIGNDKTAFGYNVEWYDDNYRHVLQCAQKLYSKDTIKKVVELAKTIDRSI